MGAHMLMYELTGEKNPLSHQGVEPAPATSWTQYTTPDPHTHLAVILVAGYVIIGGRKRFVLKRYSLLVQTEMSQGIYNYRKSDLF